MTKLTLKAEERKMTGRKVRRLRKEGILPANIYGKNVKSVSIQVTHTDFLSVYKDAGETGIVEITLGGKTRPVLVNDLQVDPVTEAVLHVDFFQVNLKEKVTANVPVELIGESPAEKQRLGTLVQQLDEIEVEALPTNLPDKYEFDVSGLAEVDATVTVGDLKAIKDVEILTDKEQIVAKVEPLREEEEEPVPVADETEGAAVEGDAKATDESSDSDSKETPEEK